MNTYDENLHDNITQSLQNQYLNALNAKSQLDTATLALFHAQDAAITAYEKETIARGTMEAKKKIKTQAVMGNNLSVNLVNSANQANGFLKYSVTNASVCAANVQAAANSIVKLAGDMGSIYSMIHAADANSDIDSLAKDVYKFINETAYEAEKSSQQAMELSTHTAEVSAANVVATANTTASIMSGLLKAVATEFDTASQTYSDDNAAFATASAAEKTAEGTVEDSYIDFKSVLSASRLMNQELNMNLTVSQAGENSTSKSKKPKDNNTAYDTGVVTRITRQMTDTENNFTFTIQFNPLTYPFATAEDGTKPPVDGTKPLVDASYYAIFVKDEDQAIFTLAEAENILMNKENGEQNYYVVCNKNGSPNQVTIPIATDVTIPIATDPDNPPAGAYYDSAGDTVVPGVTYVIFILAVYSDKYKKTLNYFDDFLSAPSTPFCLITVLEDIKASTITLSQPNGQYMLSFGQGGLNLNPADLKNFNPADPTLSDALPSVQCRCYFLPYFNPAAESDANAREIPKHMLSYHWLKRYIKEAKDVAEIYHDKIQIEKKTASAGTAQTRMDNEEKDFNNRLGKGEDDSLAFYVDLPLLESIPASNYLVNNKAQATFTIDPDTATDVFGNLLYTVNPNDLSVFYEYRIVIVTAYNDLEQYAGKYSNNVSSFAKAPVLTASEDQATGEIELALSVAPAKAKGNKKPE